MNSHSALRFIKMRRRAGVIGGQPFLMAIAKQLGKH